MLHHTNPRWIPGLVVVLAVLCLAWPGNAVPTSSPTTAAVLTPLAVLPPPNTSGPLAYHSALYVNASGPSGYVQPGVQVVAEIRAQIPSYVSSDGPAQVRVPNSIVQFASTTGVLRLYLDAVDITLGDNNSIELPVGPSVRWATAVTFNLTSTALLSTQGLAVSASWAYGQFPVQISWRWIMTAVDGTPSSGPWSPWAQVTPPQLANLTPTTNPWVIGQPYMLCLGGPVGGRTFAVHVSIANPVQQFTVSTVTVPTAFGAAYCWNSSLPSNVTPQQAFIHVWQFANVTFQLYDFPINLVVNSSSSSDPSFFTLTGWVPMVVLAIFAVGIVAIIAMVVVMTRRPRRPRTST